MAGWAYLPRFVDKVRLHLAGKLAPEYQPNFCKAFDGAWLTAAGVDAEALIEVVRNSITDGEVADWISRNVARSEAEKTAHRDALLNHGKQDDPQLRARLQMRKEESGLGHRDDIQTFVDYIDADEKRL